MSPKLPDKNYSARDQRARWVCFQIPNLWAKKGGTCNPTADISSLRHAAHFRVCRRLSWDFYSLRPLRTSSQPRHLWSNEPATDRAKSGDMRECASFWLVLLAYDIVPETWAQLSCFNYAVMLQHFLLWFFSCRDESMNPYQTDVVTHRNSGVPVKCILGIFNGIYSEQTGVPQEFVGSSSAWCLRILGRHPAINLLPRAVETVVALEKIKLSMGEVFVLDLPWPT